VSDLVSRWVGEWMGEWMSEWVECQHTIASCTVQPVQFLCLYTKFCIKL